MTKGAGVRFLGRLATEGAAIILNVAEGNVVGAAIDACQQTINMVSSIISYSEEINRTDEINKQISYKKNKLKAETEMIANFKENELNIFKEKLNRKYKKIEIDLKNKLAVYKSEVELINQKATYSFEEQKKLTDTTKKFCSNCNNILKDIEKQISNIEKLDNNKKIYFLMENYREVQQQFIYLLRTQY